MCSMIKLSCGNGKSVDSGGRRVTFEVWPGSHTSELCDLEVRRVEESFIKELLTKRWTEFRKPSKG